MNDSPRHIAVVGGGISGLAAAHRLHELSPQTRVTLLEAGPQLGGVLQTERQDGYLVEQSADTFITNVPWALDLCRRIGFSDELIPTQQAQRRALVVRNGRLQPVPEGFVLMAPGNMQSVLRSPILSLRGKLRLAVERFVPRRAPGGDESVASFARRRLGREAFERLVQPLIGGIYTADAERLSLAATMPRFIEMERRWGSLTRGAQRQQGEAAASGARYGMFVAPRAGMGSMVDALAAKLPGGTIRLSSPVEQLAAGEHGGWSLSIGGMADRLACDGLLLTLPAPAAARLVEPVDPPISRELQQIQYAGTAILLLGYARSQIADPLAGFGFVVPEVERRRILAASFSSQKFPGRAPADHILLRVFVGGAAHPEMIDLPDEELKQIVCEELGQLIGARGQPQFFRVARWAGAMPQYHLGHLERVGRIDQLVAAHGTLELAGNAYRGVGIPDCIHGAEQAAERLLAKMAIASV